MAFAFCSAFRTAADVEPEGENTDSQSDTRSSQACNLHIGPLSCFLATRSSSSTGVVAKESGHEIVERNVASDLVTEDPKREQSLRESRAFSMARTITGTTITSSPHGEAPKLTRKATSDHLREAARAKTAAQGKTAAQAKPVQLAARVNEALQMGRVIDANKRLREMEVAGVKNLPLYLDESVINKIYRVSARYEESLKELSEAVDLSTVEAGDDSASEDSFVSKVGEMSPTVDSDAMMRKTKFDYLIKENILEVRFFMEFEPSTELNALQAFVALCEFELSWNYTENKVFPLLKLPMTKTTDEHQHSGDGDDVDEPPILAAQVADGGYVSDALPDEYDYAPRAHAGSNLDLEADLSQSVHCDSLWRVRRRATSTGSGEDNIMHVSFVDALEEPLGVLWFSTYTPDEENTDEVCGVPLPRPDKFHMRIGYERAVVTIKPSKAEGDAAGGFQLTYLIRKRLSKAAHMFPNRMQHEAEQLWMDFEHFAITRWSSELKWKMLFGEHRELYSHMQRHLVERGFLPVRDLTWKDLSPELPRNWANISLADEEVEDIIVDVKDATAELSISEMLPTVTTSKTPLSAARSLTTEPETPEEERVSASFLSPRASLLAERRRSAGRDPKANPSKVAVSLQSPMAASDKPNCTLSPAGSSTEAAAASLAAPRNRPGVKSSLAAGPREVVQVVI